MKLAHETFDMLSSREGEPVRSRLAARALSAGYHECPVLEGVDFAVPSGRLTALVGPNGSGKSTLLKALARLLAPTAGGVYLDGKEIRRQRSRDVARKLGILPQGPIAPEGLTVRELVAQGRYPHQSLLSQWSEQDERAVNQAMAITHVSEFAGRPVDTLSGGQRQRCWIAMALAQETDIILLDEPTTFLDLKVQVDMLELMHDLTRSHGRTLVVVLHELNQAAAYADHLVMLRDGRIYSEGKPEAIFTREALKAVFDLDAQVIPDVHSGALVCVPVRRRTVTARRP